MAVRIRLTRKGKKKQPTYRVVVADQRAPRDGRYIEQIGRYDPRQEPSVVEIDNERARYWLGNGAQPSDAVRKLLQISGAIAGGPARRAPAPAAPAAASEADAAPAPAEAAVVEREIPGAVHVVGEDAQLAAEAEADAEAEKAAALAEAAAAEVEEEADEALEAAADAAEEAEEAVAEEAGEASEPEDEPKDES